MKLFDCHCHFHLGPRGLVPLLQNVVPPRPTPSLSTVPRQQELPSASTSSRSDQNEFSFAGAAIMSTHPRDYPQVDACVSTLHERSYMAVPCYGIHPWFLHEVLHLNDEDRGTDGGKESNKDNDWLVELRGRLMANPHAIVGEIGLDGARWRVPKGDNAVNKSRDEIANNQDNTTAWKYQKRMLSCPMSLQQEAFEQQLIVATELHRPVSIHVVQAWGELLDSLSNVQEMMRQKYSSVDSLSYLKADGKYQSDRRQTKQQQKKKHQKQLLLPPKMFFHAFSGKAGLLPSLFAAIEKCNVPRDNVYFGFSPAIPNFYSSKTPSIMKQIGIRNLLLETDLEDSTDAWNDLNEGVKGIAAALDLDVCDVANQTFDNAVRFYFEQDADHIISYQ